MNLLGKGFASENAKVKGIRRADRFAKMAVAASLDACSACSGSVLSENQTDTSIIVATMFGPHATTFRFLDNILDYSDKGVSPTVFSHSVHNAAASYIASALGIMGQTLTITSFNDPLNQALVLAKAWIDSGQALKVLVCYVDEESDPFCAAHEHCAFPSYAKKTINTRAASVLLGAGKGGKIEIPVWISDPFIYIKKL